MLRRLFLVFVRLHNFLAVVISTFLTNYMRKLKRMALLACNQVRR